jgi:hypothetical protein
MKRYYRTNKGSEIYKPYEGPDRRKYPRFDFPFFIRYKKNAREIQAVKTEQESSILFTEKGQELSISHNVSIGGICFATREPFQLHTKLTLEIFTPLKREPFTALAEVAWQRKRTLVPSYLTGVSFLQLDDEEGFKNLLEMLTEMKLEELTEK